MKTVNNSPLVSVIVPTKNEEINIVRCLESIKNQRYDGQIELIVVDNHSRDQTAALAKKFTPQVMVAGNERSEQRNIGAKAAKGQYLLFIDADMELSKEVVAEAVSLSQKKLFPPVIAIKEKSIGITFLTKALALEKNCYNYNRSPWLLAARFFPKDYFVQLGGYDETLISGEDWAITQNFLEKGFSMIVTDKAYVVHYEANIGLQELFNKEIYYIRHIDRYAKKYPLAFSYQGSFFYRGFIWIRSWRELIKHPLLTLSFLTYKFSVWLLWQFNKSALKD